MGKQLRKTHIGMNRGKPRLWLEGNVLTEAGFKTDDRFNVTIADGKLTLEIAEDGTNKVSGKGEGRARPVIDLMPAGLAQVGEVGAVLIITNPREGKLILKTNGEEIEK